MVTGFARLGPLSDYIANCRPVLSSGRAPYRSLDNVGSLTSHNPTACYGDSFFFMLPRLKHIHPESDVQTNQVHYSYQKFGKRCDLHRKSTGSEYFEVH
jgi:hypothetical protein